MEQKRRKDGVKMDEVRNETAAEEMTEATAVEPKKKKSGRHLTAKEQLARLAEQKKQIAAKERAIRARENVKERKARAHRLIQIGGIVESVFGGAVEGEPMLKALEEFLREQDRRGKYFSDALRAAENLQRRQAAACDSLPAANE